MAEKLVLIGLINPSGDPGREKLGLDNDSAILTSAELAEDKSPLSSDLDFFIWL